jgi:hypothetical protein
MVGERHGSCERRAAPGHFTGAREILLSRPSHPRSVQLEVRAREMRLSPTLSELRLLAGAAGQPARGCSSPAGRHRDHLVDFLALAVSLVVEVDGGYHGRRCGRRRAARSGSDDVGSTMGNYAGKGIPQRPCFKATRHARRAGRDCAANRKTLGPWSGPDVVSGYLGRLFLCDFRLPTTSVTSVSTLSVRPQLHHTLIPVQRQRPIGSLVMHTSLALVLTN